MTELTTQGIRSAEGMKPLIQSDALWKAISGKGEGELKQVLTGLSVPEREKFAERVGKVTQGGTLEERVSAAEALGLLRNPGNQDKLRVLFHAVGFHDDDINSAFEKLLNPQYRETPDPKDGSTIGGHVVTRLPGGNKEAEDELISLAQEAQAIKNDYLNPANDNATKEEKASLNNRATTFITKLLSNDNSKKFLVNSLRVGGIMAGVVLAVNLLLLMLITAGKN